MGSCVSTPSQASEASHSTEGQQMMSEDGWPLGEALEVDEAAVEAAERALRFTQDIWFAAFEELAADLGEPNLAGVVKTAMQGPFIRQDRSVYEFKTPSYLDTSGWTRKGTAGWWVEGQVVGRYVATCSRIPNPHASLSVGGTVLMAATCEGVHVAAIDVAGANACPSPATFFGSNGAAEAAIWAEAVPKDAMVLMAAVNRSGDDVTEVLEALSQGGLGCPAAMPS